MVRPRDTLSVWKAELVALGRTEAHAERSARVVGWFLEAAGDTWAAVRPLEASRWLAGCRGKTRSNRLSALRAWAGWCCAVELLERNPFAGLPRPRIERGTGADPMTVEELRRLLSMLEELEAAGDGRRGRWGPLRSTLYAFLALTGLRIGEAAAQEWADVDTSGGWLRVTRDKARRRDLLPLSAECCRLLERWRWWSQGPRVFPAIPSHHTIRRDLAAAGIAGAGQFHRFRKLAVTARAAAAVDYRALSRFARHSDMGTTLRHYDRVRAEELRPAAEALRIFAPGA